MEVITSSPSCIKRSPGSSLRTSRSNSVIILRQILRSSSSIKSDAEEESTLILGFARLETKKFIVSEYTISA